jgi:protein-L-isoaspartate(D-aspartate) O-methyltransferase
MKSLADSLKEKGFLKRKDLYDAFLKIDRADFIPEEYKKYAYKDIPLAIGFEQTISQPQVVAFMLELLNPKKGERILDIGFGSGWSTALLAEIVKEGKVIAIEKIPELYNLGKKNIEKYNFLEKGKVKLFLKDGRKGEESEAPYDRILISAADKNKKIIFKLSSQLKDEGRIVMPINSSIFVFVKKGEKFKYKEYPGFLFVPLQ